MQQQPKCVACGGPYLTPPMPMFSEGDAIGVDIPAAKPGLLSRKVSIYLRARLCLSCGHAALFATPEGTAKLRENWGAPGPALSG